MNAYVAVMAPIIASVHIALTIYLVAQGEAGAAFGASFAGTATITSMLIVTRWGR